MGIGHVRSGTYPEPTGSDPTKKKARENMTAHNQTSTRHKISTVVAGVLFTGLVLAAGWVLGSMSDETDEAPPYVEPVAMIDGEPSLLYVRSEQGDVWLLPRCLHEDDEDDCFWAAAFRGNGEGSNFLVIDGEVIYY